MDRLIAIQDPQVVETRAREEKGEHLMPMGRHNAARGCAPRADQKSKGLLASFVVTLGTVCV